MIPTEIVEIATLIFPQFPELNPSESAHDEEDFEYLVGAAYRKQGD